MIKVAERLNHIEEYYFSKKLREVKKLEKDGVFEYGFHYFKSGASNSCSYQWNFSEIKKTFSKWRAPSREV